jgi:hypothetical protein
MNTIMSALGLANEEASNTKSKKAKNNEMGINI